MKNNDLKRLALAHTQESKTKHSLKRKKIILSPFLQKKVLWTDGDPAINRTMIDRAKPEQPLPGHK